MAKQKLKSKSSAKKRYLVTGKGKLKAGRKGKRHILSNKNRNRKRNLKGTLILTGGEEALARKLLPYA